MPQRCPSQTYEFIDRAALTGAFDSTFLGNAVGNRAQNTVAFANDFVLRRRLSQNRSPFKLHFTRKAKPYSPHPEWVDHARCIVCDQVNEYGINSTGAGHGIITTQLTAISKDIEVQEGVGCGLCGSKNWSGGF